MNETEHRRMRAVEDSNWWFAGKRLLIDVLLRQVLGTKRVGPILDVGCGTGATMAMLTRFGEPYGIDLAPEALRLTATRGIGGLCACDAQHLAFARGSFSAVVALDVLEHLDDPAAALREMGRVCVPGGAVVLSVPAYQALWSSHDVALEHRRRYTPRMLREQVEGAGLQVARMTHGYAGFFAPVWAVRRLRDAFTHARAPQADLGGVGGPLNALLTGYMRVEAAAMRAVDLPIGTSLLCVARVGGP